MLLLSNGGDDGREVLDARAERDLGDAACRGDALLGGLLVPHLAREINGRRDQALGILARRVVAGLEGHEHALGEVARFLRQREHAGVAGEQGGGADLGDTHLQLADEHPVTNPDVAVGCLGHVLVDVIHGTRDLARPARQVYASAHEAADGAPAEHVHLLDLSVIGGRRFRHQPGHPKSGTDALYLGYCHEKITLVP